MPFELFLALRYLRMRRGRRVVKWTAGAALVGIACGVAALVVALALANGFRDELREKILSGTAHVTVTREGRATIDETRAVVARVRAVEGVTDASPTTYEGVLLSGPTGAAYAVLRGIDAESRRAREAVRRTLVAGAVEPLFEDARAGGSGAAEEARGEADEAREAPVRIIVGEELAARTGLGRVGEEGWALTGEKARNELGFEPRATRVRVAGVFRAGLYDYDAAWAYVSLDEAARVAGEGLKSAVVSVEVADVYAAGKAAARVRRELGGGGWTTVDWREANRPLFAALELERRTVALIIMLIMLLAALNITTALALVVVERRADIAVLNALGAGARSVTTIFMIEGAALGLAGALAGVALGLAACAAANHFGLIRLPPDVYSISAVTLRPHAADVVWPALAAFAVSLLATVYPALQAARVRPAEALRYE
ncbi:MAG TPA: FtsX-like permease family protein [Pyrinomonadaceae bacterium]